MDPFFAVIFPCVLLFVVAMFYCQSRRSEQIIRHWADQSGYRLLVMNRPLFQFGPFLWARSRQQTVYRVEVETNIGKTEKAWVRCGNWWTGVTSDDIEVRWDD